MKTLALFGLFVLASGCAVGASSVDDDDGGGSGSASQGAGGGHAAWSEGCPSSPVFSFMTCTGSSEGAVCPGTLSCGCGAVQTPCECTASEVGFQFVCNDDCDSLCADTASSSATGPASSTASGGSLPVTCDQFCAPQLTAGCSVVPTDCYSTCDEIDQYVAGQTCEAPWQDAKACVATATMICDAEGYPEPQGCDAQMDLAMACLGG